MLGSGSVADDVYTARDIAQAAGVPEARVLQLVARGEIRSIAALLPIAADPDLARFVAHDEAVRAVRALKQGSTVAVAGALGLGRELFAQGVHAERATTVPLIVSTSLHAVAVASILFIASLGFAVADERTEPLQGTRTDAHGVSRAARARRWWWRRRLENEDASAEGDAQGRRKNQQSAAGEEAPTPLRSRFRNRQIRRNRSTRSR